MHKYQAAPVSSSDDHKHADSSFSANTMVGNAAQGMSNEHGVQWWKQPQQPLAPPLTGAAPGARLSDIAELSQLIDGPLPAARSRPSTGPGVVPGHHSLVMQVTAHRSALAARRRAAGDDNVDDGRYPYHISPQRAAQQQGPPARFCDGGAILHDAYNLHSRSDVLGSANTSSQQPQSGAKWYESPFDVAGALRQSTAAPIRQVPIVGDTASLLSAIQIQVSMLMEQQNEAVRGALTHFQRDIQAAIGGIEQRVLAIEQQCQRMENVVLQDLQNARNERNMLAARLDAAKDDKDVALRARAAQLSTPLKGAGGSQPPSDNSVFLQRLRQALNTNGGGATPTQPTGEKQPEGLPPRAQTPGIPVLPSSTSPSALTAGAKPPGAAPAGGGLSAFLSNIVASSKEAASSSGAQPQPLAAPATAPPQVSSQAPAVPAPAPAAAPSTAASPSTAAAQGSTVTEQSSDSGEQPRRRRAPASQ